MKNRNSFNTVSPHHSVLSVFFICVTVAALVFQNSDILYWYIIGAIMELIHKIPNSSPVDKLNMEETRKIPNDLNKRFPNDRDIGNW